MPDNPPPSQILVRIPVSERELLKAVFDQHPNVSAQQIFRALSLTVGPIGIWNALSKHRAGNWTKTP